MLLRNCRECSREISEESVTCPNCGCPLQASPVVEKKAIIGPPQASGFPPWAIAAIALYVIILVFAGYLALSPYGDDASIEVNPVAQPATDPARETRAANIPGGESQPATAQPKNMPATKSVPPERGLVVIKAQIVQPDAAPQPAGSTKFFLLDKDLATILKDARLDRIGDNDMMSSLGLAFANPDRYGDLQQAAMKAIMSHVKYTGTTDAGGAAALKGVEPGGYSLFGISRIGGGVAIWNSPVSVVPGENLMNLRPQKAATIPDPAGGSSASVYNLTRPAESPAGF